MVEMFLTDSAEQAMVETLVESYGLIRAYDIAVKTTGMTIAALPNVEATIKEWPKEMAAMAKHSVHMQLLGSLSVWRRLAQSRCDHGRQLIDCIECCVDNPMPDWVEILKSVQGMDFEGLGD